MSFVTQCMIGMIRVYKTVVSPVLTYWFGPRCRFHPSCSCYASDALRIHGALRGSGLAARRLLRCHPFHPGGFDPVPALTTASTTASTRGPANVMPEESARS